MGTKVREAEPTYLISKLVLARKPKIFRRDEARFLLRSVIQYYKAQHHFQLFGYCFLPDRVHLILQPGARAGLPRIMKDIWGNFSRRVNKRWNRRGAIMRSKYLKEELVGSDAVREALAVLHRLPSEEGFSDPASGTPMSSANLYRRGLGDLFVDLYVSGVDEPAWPVPSSLPRHAA